MAAEIVDALGISPFDGREFRWRMGVKALDPAGWLQIDDRREADILEKESLLAERTDEVVAFSDASHEVEAEVLDLTVDALARKGITIDSPDDTHPLVTAARNIQEDLCILEKRPNGRVLTGGVVCFPTRWTLAEKVGRNIGAIHSPVPGMEAMSRTIDRFFDRMRPGSLVSRSNWSLTDDHSLRLEPIQDGPPTLLPPDPGTGICLRVERQTVRKLHTRDAVCFTIRIHRWALGDVVDQLPAAALSATLDGVPLDIADYKGIAGFKKELTSWLEGQSQCEG